MSYCRHCGNEILEDAVICLRCGCGVQRVNIAQVSMLNQNTVEEAGSQFGESAKICGIISLFIGWFVLGITAIILAAMSRGETDGKMCPDAKVGLICGIISTVLSLAIFGVGLYAIIVLGTSLL